MSKVTVCDHPLVQEKLAQIRDQETSPAEFRRTLYRRAQAPTGVPRRTWSGRWGSNPQNLSGLNGAPLPT